MPDCLLKKGIEEGAHIAKVYYCLTENDRKCIVVSEIQNFYGAKNEDIISLEQGRVQIKHIRIEFVRNNNELLGKMNAD